MVNLGWCVPFGECRNSQGNPGTDRLFTGQRLDGTGLYYYGARYYDVSIGRFISADTVVQSPGNPQTLNRYSYCGNNPLKYVDPTGSIFEVGNEAAALEWCRLNMEFRLEVPSWVTEWAYQRCAIEDAYDAIMSNPGIPHCIKDMMQLLHDSDRVIHIDIGDFGGGAVGISAMKFSGPAAGFLPFGDIADYIGIDVKYMSNLAPILAHECYHIYEANPGATIEEEFVAYAVQFFVERGLSGSSSLGWIFETNGGHGFLEGLKSRLVARTSSDVYSVMPLYQSQMNVGWLVKQGIALGQDLKPWWGYLGSVIDVRGIPWK